MAAMTSSRALAALFILCASGCLAARADGKIGYVGVIVDTNTWGGEIVAVAKGSPAETAGIRPGDMVRFWNNEAIQTGQNYLTSQANAMNRGDREARLKILRDCELKEFQVTLAPFPDAAHPPEWTEAFPRFPMELPEKMRRSLVAASRKHLTKANEAFAKDAKRAAEEFRQALQIWPWDTTGIYEKFADALRRSGDAAGAQAAEARSRANQAMLAHHRPTAKWLGFTVQDTRPEDKSPNGGALVSYAEAGTPAWQLMYQQGQIGVADVIHLFNFQQIISPYDFYCAATKADPEALLAAQEPKRAAMLQEADSLAKQGRRQEAVMRYLEAAKTAVVNAQSTMIYTRRNGANLTWTVTTQKRPDAALNEIYTKLGHAASGLDMDVPEEARKHFIQARYFAQHGAPSDAETEYKSGLELAPWYADGWYNLAMVQAGQNHYPEAISSLQIFVAGAKGERADAAQDKIYEYEAAAKLGSKSAGMSGAWRALGSPDFSGSLGGERLTAAASDGTKLNLIVRGGQVDGNVESPARKDENDCTFPGQNHPVTGRADLDGGSIEIDYVWSTYEAHTHIVNGYGQVGTYMCPLCHRVCDGVNATGTQNIHVKLVKS